MVVTFISSGFIYIQDYQVEIEVFQQRTEQQHIVDWVEREVVKSISPQLVCSMYGQGQDFYATLI